MPKKRLLSAREEVIEFDNEFGEVRVILLNSLEIKKAQLDCIKHVFHGLIKSRLRESLLEHSFWTALMNSFAALVPYFNLDFTEV